MHKYHVVDTELLTPTTQLITLKHSQPWKPFSYHPGQYAAISFYRRFRPTPARCFSITSSPNEMDTLQFSMRVKGHFTTAAKSIKPGDTVNVRGPFGGFVFDSLKDGNIVLLAGGIGITPFMSIIRYAAELRLSNKVTLVYSCRDQTEVAFLDDLKKIQETNPNFKVIYVIGDGPTDRLTGQTIATGRITKETLDQACDGAWDDRTFFVCGPPPFMKGMLKQLQEHGVSKRLIKTEAFGQGKNRQTGKVVTWPVNVYVFGAVSVFLGTFVVMVSDFFKTLPPSSLVGSDSITSPKNLKNNREVDLDKLVNGLAEGDYNARPSAAASTTNSVAVSPAGSPNTASSSSPATSGKATGSSGTSKVSSSTATSGAASSGSGTSSSGGGTAPAPTPTPTPTPPPAPPPPPKCTTSASGVVTC